MAARPGLHGVGGLASWFKPTMVVAQDAVSKRLPLRLVTLSNIGLNRSRGFFYHFIILLTYLSFI
jgi:hypothetical protein